MSMQDVNIEFEVPTLPEIDVSLEIVTNGTFWGNIEGDITEQTDLQNALNEKQDVLTAGDNIQIEDNVISATDTTYTAGEGISIEDNVISNTQTSAEWGNIQGDIAEQTDLIDLIDTKIDIEATARENNDLLLQNGINTLNDDLTAEISNRGTADGILQGNIDTLSGTVTNNYNTLDGKIGDNKTAIDNHIADKTNPHEVSKAQVGLGNVDNTSDLNKPISTATQNALNGKANTSDLSTVATSGDYDDLSNKPTIPTVNDATLTIQKNGSNVATFTANSSTNQTANITVPTQASDIGALPDTTTINDLTTAEQQSALNSGANTTNIGQIATNTQNISNEVTNRQNADNNLQSQIDALVVASDVFDIVGTYAELQAYDISTVPVNDIIKVLVDSTHDNAATYYRCVENDNVKSWSYIGAEGAYYTKSEADNRFVEQTTTVNGQALSNNITLDASDVGALPDSTTIGNGTLTIQKNGSTIDTFGANDTGNTTVNITVPTDTGDLTNNAGYIKGINGTDVTNALGYTPYDSSNPDGYTDNVGTVTSVNNTQPDTNGNVTISIPTQVQANWNETDTSSKAYIQNKPSLSTVATTGDYDDLTNKPTIPAAQVNSDWNASSGVAQILNKPTLSTVATSGDYDDLTNKPTIPAAQVQSNWNETDTSSKAYIQNKPTIPTDTGDLTNNAGFITGINSTDVINALGYTPYDSTNPDGYTTNAGTVTSVNNAQPDSNGNVTITIPTQVQANWNETDNTSKAYIKNKPTIPSTSNFVTTNTAQNISARKTFVGEKAINLKQSASTNKLGFTLYNRSDTEVGGLEYNPSSNILALNAPKTANTLLGFRYWSDNNIIVPKPSSSGNYYLPLSFKNGSSTVTTNSSGVADLSNLIPTIATSVSASSTNAETVGAKLFYDTVGDIETLLSEV